MLVVGAGWGGGEVAALDYQVGGAISTGDCRGCSVKGTRGQSRTTHPPTKLVASFFSVKPRTRCAEIDQDRAPPAQAEGMNSTIISDQAEAVRRRTDVAPSGRTRELWVRHQLAASVARRV